MFHYDDGLHITKAELAVDVRRRKPRAFVSHAHFDHMARHAFALCTPETSLLYQHRLGPRETRVLPLRTPLEWGGVRLTAYPAGHCLGSAMLLAEDGDESLLYTGDFKLGVSLTAERAELPQADKLVIESTYGHPRYRFPPRDEATAQLLDVVAKTLRAGATPVIQAYVLGKSQEVTRILTDAGVRVWQSPDVFEVSELYERCGTPLGDVQRLTPAALQRGETHGGALVIAPGRAAESMLGRVPVPVRISTTGWAAGPRPNWQRQVDHAICLSDHADYPELLEAIDRVAPREIYCTHGPADFVYRLRALGLNAHPLHEQTLGKRPVQQPAYTKFLFDDGDTGLDPLSAPSR